MAEQKGEKISNAEQEEECEIPNEEYEVQFFGFAPTDVYEGIKGLITDRFQYTIDKLEVQMKKIPQDILSEKEVVEGITRLKLITNENINTTLSKVKKYLLQNILKIPPNLLLPEDAEQAVPVSKDEKAALLHEIDELKMQLKTEKYMEAALAEELKDQEMVIQSQKQLLENEFSPSVQNTLEEEREKLTFLLSNDSCLQETLHSLRRVVDPSELEKRFQQRLESETFL